MNPTWREFLGAAGARFNDALVSAQVTDFGDPQAELAAARDATILAPLTHLGLIECAGDDAKSFLHGQLTSDVNHLAAGQTQHSAWCSAKGRMLASFLTCREDSAYLLQVAADLAPTVAKRLQMFVPRAQVKIADLSGSRMALGVAGDQAEAALVAAGLPVPAAAMQMESAAGATVIRLDGKRFIVLVGVELAAACWRQLAVHARAVGTPAWQWLDVQAGLPLITAATKEEFVPQMANFEQIGAVSFHKGCYPGQEIVARTQYLGKVKRHLYRLRSSDAMAAGDDLFSPENPEQPSGKIVTAAPSPQGGYEALAVVQENHTTQGELHLGSLTGSRLEFSPVTP